MRGGQRHVHLGGGAPALAGMRLVNQNRKRAAAVVVADFIQNIGKFLHRRNDDFLSGGQESPQIAGMVGMADGGRYLRELLDRVANLLVQNAAVGDDNHGIKHRLAAAFKAD